eukprot:12530072-Prorocentrum_lima.AAC.1
MCIRDRATLRRKGEQFDYFYTDCAPELIASLTTMGVPPDHSIPGMPRNISGIERANRTVLE